MYIYIRSFLSFSLSLSLTILLFARSFRLPFIRFFFISLSFLFFVSFGLVNFLDRFVLADVAACRTNGRGRTDGPCDLYKMVSDYFLFLNVNFSFILSIALFEWSRLKPAPWFSDSHT